MKIYIETVLGLTLSPPELWAQGQRARKCKQSAPRSLKVQIRASFHRNHFGLFSRVLGMMETLYIQAVDPSM